MKIKTKLRLISLAMLVVAVVFVFCALACPTLGRTVYIGDFAFGAEQWHFCYNVYAIVMVALFGASFFMKEKKSEVPVKNRKICPKCNSTDIILVHGKAGPYGSGNNIQVGWSNFSAVLVNRYVCCGCGYSEEWIDKDDLQKLKNKYK